MNFQLPVSSKINIHQVSTERLLLLLVCMWRWKLQRPYEREERGLKNLSKTEKSMSKGESTTVCAKIVNIDWTWQFIAPARERSFNVSRMRNGSLGGILLLREEGDKQKRGDASEPQQVKRKLEEKELRVLQNERRHRTLPFHYQFKKLHFTMLTKEGTLKLKNAVHKMTGVGGWRVQSETQHHCQNKTENIEAFQLMKIYPHSTPPKKNSSGK